MKKNGIMLEFFPLGRQHVLKLITNKLANLRGCVKQDTLRKNTLEKYALWKNRWIGPFHRIFCGHLLTIFFGWKYSDKYKCQLLFGWNYSDKHQCQLLFCWIYLDKYKCKLLFCWKYSQKYKCQFLFGWKYLVKYKCQLLFLWKYLDKYKWQLLFCWRCLEFTFNNQKFLEFNQCPNHVQ